LIRDWRKKAVLTYQWLRGSSQLAEASERKEDLGLAEELAGLLGAEIGCSRPISSDLKWLPEDRHIGLSGKWIRPKLYIAIGISGQIQHVGRV
jgi:electron transfer flavoprotein alpha subunit